MATLGFDNYIEPLKLYLQKYREVRFSMKFMWTHRMSMKACKPMESQMVEMNTYNACMYFLNP